VQIEDATVVVSGGASGLGLATARLLSSGGARVVVVDVADASGAVRRLDGRVTLVTADVTDEETIEAALDVAESHGPIRGLVHTAGRGGDRHRLVNRGGQPAPSDTFLDVVRVNLGGTHNMLRLTASRMMRNEPVNGERGACVLTASVAAFDGQIGQAAYAASKAGVVGMTLVAARDLASAAIRVNTIAPGTFDTAMLGRLPDEVRGALAASVPFPKRLGQPDEYAHLAVALLENSYINGETIRLDGAIRMAPR
jgi:NAD(P)-dependent dehydrogenase (short-subunit alcohol dehydrogenase family)